MSFKIFDCITFFDNNYMLKKNLKNNPKNATAAMDLLVDLFELEFDKHVKV